MRAFPSTQRLGAAGLVCAATLLAGLASAAFAATPQPGAVDLGSTPPNLTASVDPNVVLTFDDSGSMSQAFVPGRLGEGDVQFGNNAGYIVDVLDPNATQRKICSWSGVPDPVDATHPARLIHPWNYSAALNTIYFDGTAPAGTYDPPYKADGTRLPNSSITAAWEDGIAANTGGSTTTRNLTNNYRITWAGGNSPKPDYILPAVSGSPASTQCNPGSNGYMTFPFTGKKAFYYQFNGNASVLRDLYDPTKYTAVDVTTLSAAQQTAFANWYSYYRTRILAARSSVANAFYAIPGNVRLAWQRLNTGQIDNTKIIRAISDTTQRANFYTFLFASAPSGGTPTRLSTDRVATYFGNSNTGNVEHNPYYDVNIGRELSCRQNYQLLVTDGGWKDNASVITSNVDQTAATLPDGRAYNPTGTTTKIFGGGPSQNGIAGFADVAFYYWKTDLRSSLTNNVPAFIPDTSTGITGPVDPNVGNDPATVPDEVYWNPQNDPATWQHLVQFIVTFGLGGKLNFPGDYNNLRTGVVQWTDWANAPNGEGIDTPPKADDTWHGALNSRGELLNANRPSELVTAIVSVLNSVLSRTGSATALSATMSTLTQGTQGFSAGYNTSSWSGYLYKNALDANGSPMPPPLWDAGCVLTGGQCTGTGQTGLPIPDPNSRVIYTMTPTNGVVQFKWANLSATQQAALNTNPVTGLVDGFGSARVDYLRGVRTNENVGSLPTLRRRSSLLGAIINSQPQYVSGATGGFLDAFPAGSPEALAASPDANGVPGPGSYAQFVQSNRARPPTVYVGSNDGMLHAFNAFNGAERWSYVPRTLFAQPSLPLIPAPQVNKLSRVTDTTAAIPPPTVDDTPVIQDVFLGGSWKTVLVGTLRFGGRGVFAIDVTSGSSGTPMWEIDNTTAGFANLGYTYRSANVARLRNGKWVVLLSSGYFPRDTTDPASLEPAANRTSLFVIDLATGALITEISTGSATQAPSATYGLSTPAAYDLDSDQVDDIVVAGDIAGNLWRFDLSDPSSSNWKVDLMFKSYSGAGDVGRSPISVIPVAMRDLVDGRPIWIFGTGKYLGKCDRTSTSPPAGCGPDANTQIQGFYGIRDYGTNSTNYPIQTTQVTYQTVSQQGDIRLLTHNSVPLSARPCSSNLSCGWGMKLNIATELSERVIVPIVPIYSSNIAVLTTLIPKGDDPCDPDRRGAIMVVDAGTGGSLVGRPPVAGGTPSASTEVVGKVEESNAIPISGIPAAVGQEGGNIKLPGLPDFTIPTPPPHRGSWRELLNLL